MDNITETIDQLIRYLKGMEFYLHPKETYKIENEKGSGSSPLPF